MRKIIAVLCFVCICAALCSCGALELLNKTELIAYVDENLSAEEAQALGTKISAIEGVISVKFVSAEEALNDFMKDHENDAAFEGVDASALRHRFYIQVEAKSKDAVIKALQQIEGIDDVNANTLSSYL